MTIETAPFLAVDALTLSVARRTLIDEVSLRVHAGDFWCILGANGAGKTLFLHTLAGLRRIDGGAVALSGRPLAQWSLAGDTLSVHRDFTSKIDQPQCSGAIRTRSAAALKQISDSYQATVSFSEQDRKGRDATSNPALPFYNSGFSHLNAGRYELAIADFDKARDKVSDAAEDAKK